MTSYNPTIQINPIYYTNICKYFESNRRKNYFPSQYRDDMAPTNILPFVFLETRVIRGFNSL